MSNNLYEAWIGYDLDGTLAYYNGWKGIEVIGPPIPRMINHLKASIETFGKVKIFTARACAGEEAIKYVKEWCLKHIGQELEVTNVKDFGMIRLYDDRSFHVIPNTGNIILASYWDNHG
jgi:hypothetical protein